MYTAVLVGELPVRKIQRMEFQLKSSASYVKRSGLICKIE